MIKTDGYVSIDNLRHRLEGLAEHDGFVCVKPGDDQQSLLMQFFGVIVAAQEDDKEDAK